MTEDEIKNKVICIIEELYRACYIGKLRVTIKNGQTEVAFGLHTMDKPITIISDLKDDDFIQFIRNELRFHRLNRAEFFTGYKTDIYDYSCPVDKTCGCKC